MPRQLKVKTPGEHSTTLLRVCRQLALDTKLPKERVKRIQKYLGEAMKELQIEMTK